MACTIDHLRADHHVSVLRDFTDLAGTAVRAGEKGVLRGLGLDYGRMEIWIELERRGARDKLRFALRATEGPRNGRMKEYFEMGEAAEAPFVPAAPKAEPGLDWPQRAQTSFSSCVGEQAPNDTSLGELSVACDCGPAFHRDLLPARSQLSVSACLCCGTVTCSRSFGDDGRFTGNSWQERRTAAISEPVRRWIAGWPRVKMDYTRLLWPMSADFARYPALYYPSDARCADLAQLAELEARLAREQAAQSRTARLRATHRVKSAPPAGVPEDLRGYVFLWEALQLRPDSSLSDLLHHAQPRSPGCDVAADVLRQRPDAFDLIVSSLRSGDAVRRGVGFVIARDLRPADPRLAGALIELMHGFSFDPLPDVARGIVSRDRFELVLLLIAELKLASPEIIATLRTLMRKFARHDDFLADCARIVLRELSAAPQAGSQTNSSAA